MKHKPLRSYITVSAVEKQSTAASTKMTGRRQPPWSWRACWGQGAVGPGARSWWGCGYHGADTPPLRQVYRRGRLWAWEGDESEKAGPAGHYYGVSSVFIMVSPSELLRSDHRGNVQKGHVAGPDDELKGAEEWPCEPRGSEVCRAVTLLPPFSAGEHAFTVEHGTAARSGVGT